MLGQPVAVRQQHEPVVHSVQQLRHAKRIHPRRRQLDRERQPVQPRHQLGHRLPGRLVERETRIHPPGPVREQRHRLAFRPGIGVAGVRQRQRPEPVPHFPGYPQRLPARRQHPHVVGAEQQPAAQLRGRADHMLAVVQHEQQLPLGQHLGQRVGGRRRGQVADAHGRRHHGRHLRRIPC